MAVEVRRVVTGHNAQGKAVVAADERLAGVSRPGQNSMSRCDVWSSDAMPVDLSDAAAQGQKAGFVKQYNYVGTGQGTVIRITELQPGTTGFMHRTETLDYAILMSGECDLELDSGEVVKLKAGDIVVQRGTMHAWINRGTGPCKFAFVLIDANPAKVGGQELRTHYHPA
jgi:quercetin dioxygenase-like cupin family protein